MQELWAWYLAPWRRMGRKEFGIALGVVSLPGIVLSIIGLADGAGSWLGPLQGVVQGVQNGGASEVPSGVPMGGPGDAGGVDWSGLINNILMVAMIPLCRMRMLDMGYSLRMAWAVAWAMNVASVNGVVQAFGVDVLPWAMVWSVLNFGGMAWLCMAAGHAKVPMHERVAEMMAERERAELAHKDEWK